MVALFRRLDGDIIETKAIQEMTRELAAGPREILPRLPVTLHNCLYPPLRNQEYGKNQQNEDSDVHQSGISTLVRFMAIAV